MLRIFIFLMFWVGSTEAQLLKDKNRISPSYQSVIQCFPDLKKDELQNDFNLGRLKERMDQVFPSVQSTEASKVWVVKDPKNGRLRITLKTLKEGKSPEKTMVVEKLTESDIGEQMNIPADHRQQPTQKIINTYLYGNDILQEITEKIDTKPNNLKSITKQNRSGLTWLELQDSRSGLKLQCELKDKLGVICLCRKK